MNNNYQSNNNPNNLNNNNTGNIINNGQNLHDPNATPVNVVSQPVSPEQTQTTGQEGPQVIKEIKTQQNTKKIVKEVPVPNPKTTISSNNTNHQKQPEKKPATIRYVLLILFFIALLTLVWFLPDIRKMMTDRKIASQKEVINGTLKCVYEEEEELITTLYTSEFKVQNNKLKAYTSIVETKGASGSEDELRKLNSDCENLSKMLKKVSGVKNSCSLNSRKQITRQEIDYAKVNQKNLTSAYSEMGGVVPDYKLDQDALAIKKEMTLARYSCTVN